MQAGFAQMAQGGSAVIKTAVSTITSLIHPNQTAGQPQQAINPCCFTHGGLPIVHTARMTARMANDAEAYLTYAVTCKDEPLTLQFTNVFVPEAARETGLGTEMCLIFFQFAAASKARVTFTAESRSFFDKMIAPTLLVGGAWDIDAAGCMLRV